MCLVVRNNYPIRFPGLDDATCQFRHCPGNMAHLPRRSGAPLHGLRRTSPPTPSGSLRLPTRRHRPRVLLHVPPRGVLWDRGTGFAVGPLQNVPNVPQPDQYGRTRKPATATHPFTARQVSEDAAVDFPVERSMQHSYRDNHCAVSTTAEREARLRFYG